MPSFTDLAIALPCDGLEDFPTTYQGADAKNLLACWTGLWHPALIRQTNLIPEIQSVSETTAFWQTDDKFRSPLIVVPNVSATTLDSATLMGWTSKCDALTLEDISDRRQIIDQAAIASEELLNWTSSVSIDLVNDFYALGYAFLQTMLMSLKLRYSTNLDRVDFDAKVIDAAGAAVAGKEKQAADKLFACFDILLEEKNSYYPVEPQLCELILTHPNTIGKTLTKQLESSDTPISVLISGQDAQTLASKNPSAAETIIQQINAGKLSIVGGLENETDDDLVCSETIISQLDRGRKSLQQVFGHMPSVFARRSFGLNPTTPNLLKNFGYLGALHVNFSNGLIPTMGSGAMRWTGDDEEHILAISELPMDAADSGTFLSLGEDLGEMLDLAHSATALLTHWPHKACQSLSDLKQIAKFVPLFGNFLTVDQIFDEVYDPGYGQTFTSDEYEPPYLQNVIKSRQQNPVSRYTNYWQRFQHLETARRVILLAVLELDLNQSTVASIHQRIEQTQSKIEVATISDAPPPFPDLIDNEIQSLLNDATELLKVKADPTNQTTMDSPDLTNVRNFFNPHSSAQRVEVQPPVDLSLPTGSLKSKPPICFGVNQQANDENEQSSCWILDLPGFSSTTVDFSNVETKNLFQKDPPLCSDLLLQNEFFKVQIDEKSGGIRSIQQHNRKANLIGQQLAVRLPKKHSSKIQYGSMVADSVQIIENQTLSAAVKSTGRIVAGDLELARFEQTVRIVRGINRVEIDVDLQPVEALTASREHYVCSRLAWKSESARLMANVLDSCEQVANQWFHATQFVTIKDAGVPSVSLLTGGLPYHRRASRRMLDSVLMIANESQTRYSFAIAVDQPYPTAAATSRLTPNIQFPAGGSSASRSGNTSDSRQTGVDRLFHFNRKNILATAARPIFNEDGKCEGVALRLKETEARAAQLVISSFRPMKAAEIVKLNGEVFSTLPLDEADNRKVSFSVDPLSFLQVNLYFRS